MVGRRSAREFDHVTKPILWRRAHRQSHRLRWQIVSVLARARLKMVVAPCTGSAFNTAVAAYKVCAKQMGTQGGSCGPVCHTVPLPRAAGS